MKELINVKKIVVIFLTFISVFMLLILSFDYFFWWPSFKKNIRKVAPPPLASKRPYLQKIFQYVLATLATSQNLLIFSSQLYMYVPVH